MELDEETKKYFSLLQEGAERAYEIARKARKKGFDPTDRVEIPVARDLAERVEGLVSILYPQLAGSGLADAIRDLESKYGKNDERVALLAARDTALEKYCKFSSIDEKIDAGVRVGVAYLTLGVVTAPLEGIDHVTVRDGYVEIYYAGPIRSAGGTAAAMSVIITDYVRRALGIAPYEPTEEEKKRYAIEIEDYSRLVGMQYEPTEEEVVFIVSHVPVCMTGSPTEDYEVSNYKDLPRVPTNRIRGGMCLVVGEGLTLKAKKLLKRINKIGKEFGLEDWLWLEEYNKIKDRIHAVKTPSSSDGGDVKYIPSTKFIERVIAGRPVLAYPARPGGLRLRYGRSRTCGIAATSLHPAMMHLVEFVAVGTQLATELPGKATVATPCDRIEPPVVLLDDGEVRYVCSREEAEELRPRVKKILSLGDILIPFGEFWSQGHVLLPGAYCEEWWALQVRRALEDDKSKKKNVVKEEFLSPPYPAPPFDVALEISRELNVPLHPAYNYFWHDLSMEDVLAIARAVSKGGLKENGLVFPFDGHAKKALENACVPHKPEGDRILIPGDHGRAVYHTLGRPSSENISEIEGKAEEHEDVLSFLSAVSGTRIMPKGLTRVGIKMGRPEKAERRLMKGRPQILFPCGSEGGRMRNLMASYEKGHVKAEFPTFWCPSCNRFAFYRVCPYCGKPTIERRVCQNPKCGSLVEDKNHCGRPTLRYKEMRVNVRELIDIAASRLGIESLPDLFKGVRGVSGPERDMERLEKGLLRVKHELFVNKDGTTRYDSIDVPLTHFKPREIGAPVDVLKMLGYEKDVEGRPLESPDQVLELKPQDIIISDNPDFSGAEYLYRVACFVDDMLELLYGLPRFYNLKDKKDLIGHLVVGLAPHTSAGILGRIIGFTRCKACFAHPLWHAAKRRNCDGDEDSIMLLLDALINFSRKYLPTTRGAATMDVPLVLTTILNPEEVDDEAWNVDTVWEYPLELYEASHEYLYPWDLEREKGVKIPRIEDLIGTPEVFHIGFTHDTTDINDGPYKSKYVRLATMNEKIETQLALARTIRAVDEDDVAERVLFMHFFKDIKGNLRGFSRQEVRCIDCNEKYRRVPLSGKCQKCGGKLVLTIHEGTVLKYVEPSKRILENFRVGNYARQQFMVMEREIEALFGKKDRQVSLGALFGNNAFYKKGSTRTWS